MTENPTGFILAVLGDSIQSELWTLKNLFFRVHLNLERDWDYRLNPVPQYSKYKLIRKDSPSSLYQSFYSTKKALDFSKASPINLGSQYLDAHVLVREYEHYK